MHRIDTPTAQKDKFGAGKNGFTRGNPQTGTPATDLDDDYFDMLQEELVSIVEAAGITLNKANRSQLKAALPLFLGLKGAEKLSAAMAVQGTAGYLIIPALVAGTEKNIIVQWGSFAGLSTGDTPVTFPIPFPNAVRHVWPCAQASASGAYAGYNTATKTGFNGNMWASVNTRQPGISSYLAIGE